MGVSRQEYWSGLPCSPPGDFPDPGIKPYLLSLLHWPVGSLTGTTRTTIGSSNSTPGYIVEKIENTNFKRYIHPSVHNSTIYSSEDMEATQVPINR